MDILSAAQQQINDAAKTFDPNASSGSAPPSPPPDQPIPMGTSAPLLKEEAILPSPPEGAATTMPSPAPTPPPEPQNPPSPPAFEPSLSDAGDATKTFGGPPPEDSGGNKAPPPQKKGVGKGVIIAGLFLLLATLPVAVYYISQQQKQVAEIRSRAAGGTCTGTPTNTPACQNAAGGQLLSCLGKTEGGCQSLTACGCVWKSSQENTIPTAISPSLDSLKLIAGTISGTICRDTIKNSGAVFFFNTTKKTVQFMTVDEKTTTYTKQLIPGTYLVQFQSDTDQSPLGYTDSSNRLKAITLDTNQVVPNIDLCDLKSSAPGTDFKSEDITLP